MKQFVFMAIAAIICLLSFACGPETTPPPEEPRQKVSLGVLVPQPARHIAPLEVVLPSEDPVPEKPQRQRAASKGIPKAEWIQENIMRVELGFDGIFYLVNDGDVFIAADQVYSLASSDSLAKANPYLHSYCRAAATLIDRGQEGDIDIHTWLDDQVGVDSTDNGSRFLGISDISFVWQGEWADTRHMARWAEAKGLRSVDALELRGQFVNTAAFGALCDDDDQVAMVRCAALLRAVTGQEDALGEYTRFFLTVQRAER